MLCLCLMCDWQGCLLPEGFKVGGPGSPSTAYIHSFWKPHPGISLRLASSSCQSVTNSKLEVNRQQVTVDLNDLSSPNRSGCGEMVTQGGRGEPHFFKQSCFHVALPPLVFYWASSSVIGLLPGSSLSPSPTFPPPRRGSGIWVCGSPIMKSRVCSGFDAFKPSRVCVEGCIEHWRLARDNDPMEWKDFV